jgi:hypothetical protein
MNPDPRHQASVLIFAVLLLAAGIFVLTGLAQIGATQALVGQDEWRALERRIRLENSRAIARQFMLSRMFAGPVTNTVTFTAADGLGGFTLSPVEGATPQGGDYWTTFSTTNTNVNLNINPFTLMERGGFYRVVVPGTITDGTEQVDWNFQIRTRSPVTAGYPVVQHKPAAGNIAALVDPPYIDMNEPEQFVGFHEMARMRVSSVTNTNAAGETTGYEGYFDAPERVLADGFFTNAYLEPVDVGVTALRWVVDLGAYDPSDLSEVLVYRLDDPAFNIRDYTDPDTGTVHSNVPVTSLLLQGTEANSLQERLPPLQVVVAPVMTNLRTVLLQGRNPPVTGRDVYLNFQRSPGSGETLLVRATNATGLWRIGISAAHSDVLFETGGIDIVGGVRTDGVISGNPSLRQEQDPGGLDYIADRMMWLEDYRTP